MGMPLPMRSVGFFLEMTSQEQKTVEKSQVDENRDQIHAMV
jgi:hypothetical protein